MAADDGPCFDPACGCCVAWEKLDDARREVIAELLGLAERAGFGDSSSYAELLSRARGMLP